MIRKMLIATTNKGKILEMKERFKTLPFIECVSLDDIGATVDAPDEPADTLHENSYTKAKYYADQTGLLALADDSGLFIDILDGWPGAQAAHVGDSDDARVENLLEKMKGKTNRTAWFRDVLTLYDPITKNTFQASGKVKGTILDEPTDMLPGRFAYDSIFFHEESGKSFGQMETHEKMSVSHRGQSQQKIHYHLQNTFGVKHIVVAAGIVIKDGKVLKNLRNDPHNKKFHKLWEFPGGTIEFGESPQENVIREVSEEVGYDVEVVEMLPYVSVHPRESETFQYQVYILPFVCKVVGGSGEFSDLETLEIKWFDIDEIKDIPNLMPGSKVFMEQVTPQLKDIVARHNL